MRIGSLFSGAGGLDMAVEAVFGAETVWQCEVDAAASKVLEYRWGAPNHGDITKVPWDQVEPVDIICAGWPCQPFSHAGKRKGAEDERALWPYVAGTVRVVRPRYVVLENVSAVLGPEFQRVANDLAADGYDLAWTCLRASDAGAPHWRNRFFAIATNPDIDGLQAGQLPRRPEAEVAGYHRGVVSLPDTADDGLERSGKARGRGPGLEDGNSDAVWGRYAEAVRRWEKLTRPAPHPVESGPRGPRLDARFAEWMMGWPDGWVTGVPGLSRSDQIRIIGNGVCPQQARQALNYLLSLCVVAA